MERARSRSATSEASLLCTSRERRRRESRKYKQHQNCPADQFVAPAARSNGVGRALLQWVIDISVARKWSGLQWLTAEDNTDARRLYDRVGKATSWVTYEVELNQ